MDAIIFTSASNVNSFFEIMDKVSKDESAAGVALPR